MSDVDPHADDWRLTNQRDSLQGVALTRAEWAPRRPESDHDHCAFCWAKFGSGGDQTTGYTTDDRYHWICESCFPDFRASFAWTVRP